MAIQQPQKRTRSKETVLSEERKKQQQDNYDSKKEIYNANKYYKRVMNGEVKNPRNDTIENHKKQWTTKQYEDILRMVEQLRYVPPDIIEQPDPQVIVKPQPLDETDYILNKEDKNPNNFSVEEARAIVVRYSTSESTRDTYKSRINALMKLFNIKTNNFDEILTTNSAKKVYEEIIEKYLDPTSYFNLIYFISDRSPKLRTLVTKEKLEILKNKTGMNKEEQQLKTINKRDNDTTDYVAIKESVFEKEEKLRKAEKGSLKHIILVLYSIGMFDYKGVLKIIPRNYYSNVKLIYNEDEIENNKDNYYNVNNGRMLIQSYKTSGKYGTIDEVLSNQVRNILKYSIEKYPRKYLIEKKSGGVYKQSNMSTLLHKILGYTMQTIRKAMENSYIQQSENRLLVNAAAKHSILVSQTSYVSQNTTNIAKENTQKKILEKQYINNKKINNKKKKKNTQPTSRRSSRLNK